MNFDEVGTIDAEYEKGGEIVQAGTVLDLDIIRPRFEDYKQEAARIAAESKALMVTDQGSLNRAVELGGTLKGIASKVEVQRKAIISEYQVFIDRSEGIEMQFKATKAGKMYIYSIKHNIGRPR